MKTFEIKGFYFFANNLFGYVTPKARSNFVRISNQKQDYIPCLDNEWLFELNTLGIVFGVLGVLVLNTWKHETEELWEAARWIGL